MGNWLVKWVPKSNASFRREWFPTQIGEMAYEYVSKFGSPRPTLQVRAVIHVSQYGSHRYFGERIEGATFRAHWGLKTDRIVYMDGINLGTMGTLYSTDKDP